MKRKLTTACLAMALALTPVSSRIPALAQESFSSAVPAAVSKDEMSVKTVDDDDASVVYCEGNANSTGWTGGAGSDPAASEHWSNVAGATFTMTFTGSGVELYGFKAPNHRKFSVKIDDLDPITCDAYASSRSDGNALYFSSFDQGIELAEGSHTLLFTTLNEQNAACTGSTIGLSFTYAKVYSNASAVPDPFAGYTLIDDAVTTSSNDLFAINYTSSGWVGGADSAGHDGTEHYANNAGTLSCRFIGTKIEFYGTKASAHGTYTFSIDGTQVGTASASAPNRTAKQLIWSSDTLEEGEHTLTVSFNTSGKAIQIDYLKVFHSAIAPDSITLSASSEQLFPGESAQMEVTYSPWYAYCPTLEWSSSHPDVISVNDGRLKAADSVEGRTAVTITATVPGTDLSASKTFTVDPALSVANVYIGDEMRLDLGSEWSTLHAQSGKDYAATIWKNDTASAKLVVSSMNEALTNVTLSASAFTNEEGDVLDPSLTTLGWLEDVTMSQGRANASAPKVKYPEKITGNKPISMNASTTRFAWVSLSSNAATAPGRYSGTISVSADQLDTPFTFPFTLDVLNLDLPDLSSTKLQLWQHPFAVADYYKGLQADSGSQICTSRVDDFYFTKEHLDLMRDSMEDYAAIGGHEFVANIVDEAWNHQSFYNDPSMVTWTKKVDGSWSFDYSWYDKWVEFGIETGILDPANGIGSLKCYSMVPWNNQIKYYDEATGRNVTKSYTPGNADWTAVWTAFLNDFLVHSEEKGWLDITYIAMDERDASQLRPAVNLVHSLTSASGKRFKVSSCVNSNVIADSELTAKIDDICANLGNTGSASSYKALSEQRRAEGKVTTFYTCTGNRPTNFASSDPVENYWSMLYSLHLGCDGYLRWAFDNYVSDMHGDASYRYWEPGDCWFIYPMEVSKKDETVNGRNYYSTPRYEAIRKGMRDVAKAKFLLEHENVAQTDKDAIQAAVDALYAPATRTGSYGEAVLANASDREALFTTTKAIETAINQAALTIEEQPEEPVVLDYTWLQAVVDEAKTITAEEYGELSETFVSLRKQAEALIDAANDQEEIDTMTDNLSDELLALRYLPVKARLDALPDSTK